MDINQSDRDKLRASQHKLHPEVIGNIIEHKSQNPKKYKDLSKGQGCSDKKDPPNLPQIHYESKFSDTTNDSDSLHTQSKDLNDILPEEVNNLDTDSYFNMDRVEFDKLEWLGDKVQRIHEDKLQNSTQFNKEGQATTGKSTSQLKESCEETHDIESLVNLLDSAYDPQIGYALKVISKIIDLAHMGYYDGSFDENIQGILIKNCLLRVRHHLDHTNETICQNAIKCLRSLLCNTQVDEILLDRTFPLFSQQPNSNLWLHTVEMDSQNFTLDMKDIECVEVDTILAVILRTNIIERFTYLIEHKSGEFGFIYQDCILDILIRMVRHSPTVAKSLNSKPLFSLLRKMFLTTSITTENNRAQQLAYKTLKLTRIVVQAYFELQLMNKRDSSIKLIDLKALEDILPSLEAYFFIDFSQLSELKTNPLMKLHIETLRILKLLCSHKKFQNKVICIATMAPEELHPRFKALNHLEVDADLGTKISIEWQYAAHMIDFSGYAMSQERYHKVSNATSVGRLWDSWVRPMVLKWISSVIRAKTVPHLDISITLACALFHFRTCSYKSDIGKLYSIMFESVIDNQDPTINTDLSLFKILARSAAQCSHLPQIFRLNGRLRDLKSLPSYGFLNFNVDVHYNFKVVSLFDSYSPFILLYSYLSELKQPKIKTQDNLATFIDCLEISRYIKVITDQADFPRSYETGVQQSLAAQYELEIITNSLLLMSEYYLTYSEDLEAESVSDAEPLGLAKNRVECYGNICYYTILVVGLLIPNSGSLLELKDHLFEKILFNTKFQTRITREEFKKHKNPTSQLGCFISGITPSRTLTSTYLNILSPIYLSCEQYDRFWIFQPLIEYYWDQFKDVDESKEKENHEGKWYYKNVCWRIHTGEIVSADDIAVVRTILSFNNVMMDCSPAYLNLVVKPNRDDYLCILGTLFLDDNVFHDQEVSLTLLANLKNILLSGSNSTKSISFFTDESKVIESLELTLGHFFTKVVDQFEAASYGDITFSNFLLLFLSTSCDKTFRKKLFQEKVETCLSQIRIDSTDLLCDKEIFLGPKEQDPEIIELIKRSNSYIRQGSYLYEYLIYHTS